MDNALLDQDKNAPSLEDIHAAALRLQGISIPTPLLENVEVNALLGGRLLLKCENMQRTGAFKFRGAYNRIAQMDAAQKQRGVITYSSGNHAQGVALAAKIRDTTALIVMPGDVPQAKIAATRALGAEVVFFDRDRQVSDDVVQQLCVETSRIIVPPSEDRRILAGGGTVALEILDHTAKIDTVLVPCGGGGITAATALVMHECAPKTQVFGAEPALFDDTRRSLLAGERLTNPKGQKTICDAIMTPTPNALTFMINQKLLAGVVTASDDEVCRAMLFAFEHFKIVIEPGAAVGLAAILSGQTAIQGKTIAVILTGGNVDIDSFSAALTRAQNSRG